MIVRGVQPGLIATLQRVIPNKNQSKNMYILLVGDVTLIAYKVMSFNIRSPLMKTLDRSVETLAHECNLCVVNSFI